jgi:hypothetical protein
MDTPLLAAFLTSLTTIIQLPIESTVPCEAQYCRETEASALEHSYLLAFSLSATGAIAPCSMDRTSTDCQAQHASDLAGRANTSNEINCDLGDRAHRLDTALVPRDDPWPSDFLNDESADVPIWKTISVGTYEGPRELREALDSARCRIGDLAKEAFNHTTFPISESRTTIDLVVLTVANLGFKAKDAPLREIYARAAKLGLELCPAEVGPQLRLQYTDQPAGEFLHIAMQPVPTNRKDLVTLTVANGGAGLLLIGGDGRPDLVVPSTVRFVFVHRTSPRQHSRRNGATNALESSLPQILSDTVPSTWGETRANNRLGLAKSGEGRGAGGVTQ